MWAMFFAAAALAAAFLFVPGYVLLRAFRLVRPAAVACAPLVSIPAYMALCIAYGVADVPTWWGVLAGPVFAVAAAAWAASLLVRWRAGGAATGEERLGLAPVERIAGRPVRCFDGWCLALYLAVGVAASAALFVWFLGSPDSYVQEFDNVSHLGTIRGFIDSGSWSPFSSSLYATAADASVNPLPGTGFYPTAWYTVAALAVSATGISVAMSENVANFVFVAAVLPAGMFLLMRAAFPSRPSVVPFGAVCVLAFSAFPWGIISFGPLFPNASAFCLVPAVAACFMGVFAAGARKRQRVFAAALFCVGMAGLAFAQPNAVFTAAVLLAPFCVWKAEGIADALGLEGARRRAVRIGCALAMCAVVAVVWYALYRAPFLRAVVEHSWAVASGRQEAVLDALVLGFRYPGSQIVLAALVAVGALCTLKHREWLWMAAAYAAACVQYVFAVSSDGPLQHLLSGFWYTDSYRLAAMASLFAVPLAALGLWCAVRGLAALAARIAQTARGAAAPCAHARALAGGSAAVVVAAFAAATFWPGLAVPGSQSATTAFASVMGQLHAQNTQEAVYDDAEQAFVDKVQEAVPEGALVLNEPHDGSAFAAVADGLRTYYRYPRGYDEGNETSESMLIRDGLCRIASDEAVRDAVRSVGGEYLLLLDQGEPQGPRAMLFTYEDGSLWRGIEAVDDSTPGFEVVLAEGDMRLYKITALD